MDQRQKDEGAAWTQTLMKQHPAKVFADGAAYGRKDLLQALLDSADDPATKLWLATVVKGLGE